MTKVISYDKKYDILTIHKGFDKDETFKGNVDIGDLILDVSTKGKIKGIEIMNATKFFKDFKIKKSILEDISDADFNATLKPNSIILGINIKSKEKEIPAKIAVPLQNPIS